MHRPGSAIARHYRRPVRWWVLLPAMAALAAGCGTAGPLPPSAAVRAGLGSVGVTALAAPPQVHVVPIPAGRLEGAAGGAGAAVVSSVNGCLDVDPTGICALGALVLSPYLALGGAIYGTATAHPEGEVAAARRDLAAVLDSEARQPRMARRALHALREAYPTAALVPASGPGAAPTATPGGGPIPQGPPFETLLEVGLIEVSLGRRPAVNPPLPLRLKARARLLRVRDGRELYRAEFLHESPTRLTFLEWSAGGGRPLRDNLEQGYRALAGRIAQVLLARDDPATPR